MPVFKGPDKKYYRFNEYDDDYVVPNSSSRGKHVTDFNNDLFDNAELGGWNRNHFSVKKKQYRDIVVDKDYLMAKSQKYHKKIKPRKWYNW